MGVWAGNDRGLASNGIRVDNLDKDPLDRQFGREVGGQLKRVRRHPPVDQTGVSYSQHPSKYHFYCIGHWRFFRC